MDREQERKKNWIELNWTVIYFIWNRPHIAMWIRYFLVISGNRKTTHVSKNGKCNEKTKKISSGTNERTKKNKITMTLLLKLGLCASCQSIRTSIINISQANINEISCILQSPHTRIVNALVTEKVWWVERMCISPIFCCCCFCFEVMKMHLRVICTSTHSDNRNKSRSSTIYPYFTIAVYIHEVPTFMHKQEANNAIMKLYIAARGIYILHCVYMYVYCILYNSSYNTRISAIHKLGYHWFSLDGSCTVHKQVEMRAYHSHILQHSNTLQTI